MNTAPVLETECSNSGSDIDVSDLIGLEAERRATFQGRHIGPSCADVATMLRSLGESSLDGFTARVVPESIASQGKFSLKHYTEGMDEAAGLARLREIATKNIVTRPYIGMGYYGTETPSVILRNILENPGWYTQYTPYQPEISQGRLEALLNYQTMVTDLTGLDVANASMLDEGTAAAEAMALSFAVKERSETVGSKFFVSELCFPQTIAVVQTRAEALGLEVVVGNHETVKLSKDFFGALLQYPAGNGAIYDYREFITTARASGALVTIAADILALTLLTPPGELGADIAVGSTQRFGVPLGFGGPHAAYFATRDEFKRQMPGRLIGVSIDSKGRPALRLSLQTREQHIRREKATSNICTAQVLLAVIAGMYAAYHGPRGLKRIAERVNALTTQLAAQLQSAGCKVVNSTFFDTLTVAVGKGSAAAVTARAVQAGVNLRVIDSDHVGISLDETTRSEELAKLTQIIAGRTAEAAGSPVAIPAQLQRSSKFLTHPVFNRYHSETEMLRYLRKLEARDLSLANAMIPLGSCTMKLNAATEMLPVTWPEFGALHPFAPASQTAGYTVLCDELEQALIDVTGYDAVSLQPNAGSQGEYAGLLVIRAYHHSRGDQKRTVCLIPRSAHGTNPASAVMAGFSVVVVECDAAGNVDLADLQSKAEAHRDTLAALMVTYPSTHGVFEEQIRKICEITHANGGQVYMDGANLNALVGLARPGEFGADVSHINLHKTFCIPHGGGGPGMGPIGVKSHLAPFLPNHPLVDLGHKHGVGPVSAAPWGSASILTISWMYIALMGAAGMRRASQVAILSANYIAHRLRDHYPVLFKGANGYVAHECILDLREMKKSCGVEVDDVAKRLMDYGFHAPTVSWPVAGTMMVEPTESESLFEIDRFCDALIAIREEARQIEQGKIDRANNPLKNAPHTAQDVTASEWDRPYSREQAAFPTAHTKDSKFWPTVGRIDSSYGDRNLVCTCPSIDSYGDR